MNLSVVQAKVIATMRAKKYLVVVVFDHMGDVQHAVCKCPAGKGPKAKGHCSHIGALLFCIEEFCQKGFRSHPEAVPCTSKINGWIVPRNIKVSATPLPNLKIRKNLHGKKENDNPTVTTYDPRAPQDRFVDPQTLYTLYSELEECLPASGFFLFHEQPEQICDTDINISGESLMVGENVEVVTTPRSETTSRCESNLKLDCNVSSDAVLKECTNSILHQKSVLSDDIPINSDQFQCEIKKFIKADKLDEKTIKSVEEMTRKQSGSDLWHNIRKVKLTSSNFGKAIKCSKNPDGALKYILYSNFTSNAMKYGRENEEIARQHYLQKKSKLGTPVTVKNMGLILCQDRPGLGTSVDGYVYDINEQSYGCLEVKCPQSRAGLSVEAACKIKPFCLIKGKDGEIKLNRNHDYYYQVLGQMFITGSEWTDFVVWFGNEDVFIERITFDRSTWESKYLPALDFFYRNAFVPELLTRRVERGIRLYEKGKWNRE